MAVKEQNSAMIVLRRLMAFIRLGRYHFLAGGFLMFGLGATIAAYTGVHIQWTIYVWGQTIVTATQLMVHYANDYFDLEADRQNITPTAWSGGSRVLLENELSPQVALVAALLLGFIALAMIIALVIVEHPAPIVPILAIIALALSWCYSAPPFRLHSRGIGEITAALIVCGLTPLLAFALQAGRIVLLPALSILPILPLQFNMLLSVAMPDVESDSKMVKRTLAVLLGRTSAARLYLVCLAATYLSLPFVVWAGLPAPVAAAFMIGLPMGAVLGLWVAHGAWECSKSWTTLAFFSIALLMISAALELVAFLAMSVRP